MSNAATAIHDYAIIGDSRSAALVSRAGSIDWLCWPRFDSASLFGALLDAGGGGRFGVAPAGPFRADRWYAPQTNVLITRFSTDGGDALLTDFMPAQDERLRRRTMRPESELLRIVECTRGELELDVCFEPRPDYARERCGVEARGALGFQMPCRAGLLALQTRARLQPTGTGARGRVRLRAGERIDFALTLATRDPAVFRPLGDSTRIALEETLRFWREWSGRTTYEGPFREAVVRSALVLKLLSYAPSGAILAAPTTSLPERPGGDLNWDYRYCWLRDASLTARALFGLGHHEEAEAFVSWLLNATSRSWPELHVLYDVHGRKGPREQELPHLSGYGGARPVRIGNAAADQLQLDLYGEVVGATTYLLRSGGSLERSTQKALVDLGKLVCERWREPDQGIWEVRGERRHFTHSRVLCWATLDCLLDMHERNHLRAPVELFARERQRIREEVERAGYSESFHSYTRTLGGGDIDASLLLLPWYGYTDAAAPRMKGTFARIRRDLYAGEGLYRRYHGRWTRGEGAFGICSFWAVEYLAMGGGSPAEAESAMRALLRHANDVGLYGEEILPETGAALGNFPQAYTHVGLINAALTLHERVTGRHAVPERGRSAPAEASA